MLVSTDSSFTIMWLAPESMQCVVLLVSAMKMCGVELMMSLFGSSLLVGREWVALLFGAVNERFELRMVFWRTALTNEACLEVSLEGVLMNAWFVPGIE